VFGFKVTPPGLAEGMAFDFSTIADTNNMGLLYQAFIIILECSLSSIYRSWTVSNPILHEYLLLVSTASQHRQGGNLLHSKEYSINYGICSRICANPLSASFRVSRRLLRLDITTRKPWSAWDHRGPSHCKAPALLDSDATHIKH
jgi:hypothetical protein